MELCRLRIVSSLTIKYNRRVMKTSRSLLSFLPMTHAGFDRSAHTQYLTKNMQYISNCEVSLKLDTSTLKLNQTIDKPLCIMLFYLMAKPKHVLKYADLYLTHGFDVIAVSCTPSQVIWPVTGTQVIADRILSFLEANKCGATHPLTVHGFSVGAYLWAELLVKTTKDKARYQPVLDRITAQVWDSPADVDDTAIGVPPAVFPKSKFLQKLLIAYIRTHMRVLYNVSTKYYVAATKVYQASPCKAPGLFLVSKTDPIGVEKNSRRAAAAWEDLGIKCNVRCWDRSPHVQHYMHHPEEYRAALYSHLLENGSLKNS